MKSEALIAGPVVLLKRLCTRSILSLGMLSASKGSERCECETMEHSHTVSLDFADQYYRRQLHCYNVTIRALPKVDFQAKQNKYYTAKRVDPASDAWTYFMKFHVFDAYFAAWDRVLYLDSGIAVQKPIQHILDLNVSGKLTAFSDTWPDYTWRLHGQFYPKEYPAEYEAMKKQNYNLEIDYFMSTVMYYDTRAVLPHPVPLRETTVALLYALAREFPHCNGDQAIMALLFCAIKPVWTPLPIRTSTTLLYDYLPRSGPAGDYVMLKMNSQQVPPERLCTDES
eukprot:m.379773 g.379773  ORF g.379773 m.379773 type:complete len:283 (-) comp20957_c2_seq22:76-924(-)